MFFNCIHFIKEKKRKIKETSFIYSLFDDFFFFGGSLFDS